MESKKMDMEARNNHNQVRTRDPEKGIAKVNKIKAEWKSSMVCFHIRFFFIFYLLSAI